MKNTQRGFITPLLFVLIAVLLVSGGVYVYENKKAEAPATIVDIGTQQSDQNQQLSNIQISPVTTQQDPTNSKAENAVPVNDTYQYQNTTTVTTPQPTYNFGTTSPVTVSLSATPLSVIGDQKTLVEWKSTNANECYLSFRNQFGTTPFKKESTQMSDDMSFGVTTTMDVYCVGSNGKSDIKSITVNVTPTIQ